MDLIKDIFKGFWEHFSWLFLGLIGIGILWFFSGGADRQTAHEGAYIKPLAPLDSGQVYGHYYAGASSTPEEQLNLPEGPANAVRDVEGMIGDIGSFMTQSKQATVIHTNAVTGNGVTFDGIAGAKSDDPKTEYIRLVAGATMSNPVLISGLRLVGTAIDGISIPRGAFLPITGQPFVESDVSLSAGDRALITSGDSPIGTSFQVNACSGYLNETGTFTPALRMDCPDGSSCKTDTAKGFTYNGCVAAHKNDKGFYTGEWRLFLEQPTVLWKDSSEIIQLVDSKGTVIDAITY